MNKSENNFVNNLRDWLSPTYSQEIDRVIHLLLTDEAAAFFVWAWWRAGRRGAGKLDTELAAPLQGKKPTGWQSLCRLSFAWGANQSDWLTLHQQCHSWWEHAECRLLPPRPLGPDYQKLVTSPTSQTAQPDSQTSRTGPPIEETACEASRGSREAHSTPPQAPLPQSLASRVAQAQQVKTRKRKQSPQPKSVQEGLRSGHWPEPVTDPLSK